jgi:hypothetical protein
MENTSKFNTRAFVSITMFIFIIILIISGFGIQIVESIGESYGSRAAIPPTLPIIMHFTMILHVLVGAAFSIFSIVHIIKNWKALKKYFINKNSKINKEILFAVLLTIIILTVVFLISFMMGNNNAGEYY